MYSTVLHCRILLLYRYIMCLMVGQVFLVHIYNSSVANIHVYNVRVHVTRVSTVYKYITYVQYWVYRTSSQVRVDVSIYQFNVIRV